MIHSFFTLNFISLEQFLLKHHNYFMKFGLILTGVTVATLILIFGFYKLFLEKEIPAIINPTPPVINQNSKTQAPKALPGSSVQPAASAAASSPSVSPKPKASAFKSTIGTITVLQNNTTSSQSSSSSGNSTISGTISFTGTAPSSTSIVIVARKNGSGDSYKTVVSGISASNSAAWSWATAESGTAYDMVAVLKGSSGGVDTDYATSQTYVVTAPALSQIFSVNATEAPDAPTGTITTTCTTHNSNNTWYATINYPTVSGGQWYIMQAGASSGASDLANTTQAAQSGTNQTINVILSDSISYYVQYSVANAPYPTSAQYSDFSTPMTVRCP